MYGHVAGCITMLITYNLASHDKLMTAAYFGICILWYLVGLHSESKGTATRETIVCATVTFGACMMTGLDLLHNIGNTHKEQHKLPQLMVKSISITHGPTISKCHSKVIAAQNMVLTEMPSAYDDKRSWVCNGRKYPMQWQPTDSL